MSDTVQLNMYRKKLENFGIMLALLTLNARSGGKMLGGGIYKGSHSQIGR